MHTCTCTCTCSEEIGGGIGGVGGVGAGVGDYRWDRTVLVSGLPPFTDPVEVYELEKALYTLFADYAPEAVLVGECNEF